MIYITDDIHCEPRGPYASFEEAIAELRRRASIPWDEEPNCAPCMSWRTCGRNYEVCEYEDGTESSKQLRRVHVLSVSAKRTVWVEGFEQKWASGVVEGRWPPFAA